MLVHAAHQTTHLGGSPEHGEVRPGRRHNQAAAVHNMRDIPSGNPSAYHAVLKARCKLHAAQCSPKRSV